MLERLAEKFGPIEAEKKADVAPADRFLLPDGTRFGIIASVTEPFCKSCDRSRLTADGMWYLCLYAREGVDLRQIVREGADQEGVMQAIRATWGEREERGAEERLDSPERGVLYQVEELKQDLHREMHTRGG